MRSIFRRALFAPKSRKNRRRRDKGQVTHRLEQLEVRRNLAILFGTGQGVNPTSGVTSDPHWEVVALPAIVDAAFQSDADALATSGSYAAYNPLPSGLPRTAPNIFYAWDGYDAGGGVTNYWMAPNTGGTSLVTASPTLSANYNWIAAQEFTVSTAGVYAFNFQGTADNAISFYINGSITDTDTQNPTITGGTKIGGTYNNFRQLWTFTGSAYLNAGTNTAYMVLNDYGSRTAALITQSEFLPASASVNDITVNEASPYAVFSVTLSNAQGIELSLANGTATGGTTSPTDGSVDFSTVNLQYSLDNGSTWVEYSGPFDAAPSGGAAFLVRTTLVSDTTDEVDETFLLNVTQNGATVTGTATINDDDATGDIYIGVNNITVNEASPHAVFAVAMPSGLNISLFVSNGTATGGTTSPTDGSIDFGNAALQYSVDNGVTWTAYTTRFAPTLTNGATSLLVRTTLVNDTTPDNNETFTLTVVPNTSLSGSAFTGNASVVGGTATIKDDGSGTIFKADGSENTTAVKNNDMAVSSPTVNEASQHVVFIVSVTSGQNLSLALSDGTATGGTTSPTDGSIDFGNAALQYSLDNGVTWVDYAGTFDASLTGSAPALLVRTTLVNDTTSDDGETLTLTATATGGTGVVGTATIKDDGTGVIFNPDGTENTTATKDDDRVLTVTDVTVNEASPYAVFTVTGGNNQQTTLALSGQGGTGQASGLTTLEYFDGTAWQPYAANQVVSLIGTSLLVRVALSPEQETALDTGETFTLVATNTGGTASTGGTGTINDDGTGGYFAVDNDTATPSTPAGVALDDDRPVTVTSPTVNEASPFAVFTVDGEPGQLVSLTLTPGTATPGAGNDYTASMEVSTDGGTTWVPYTSGTVALDGTGGTILVRVPVLNDTTDEPDETFTLTATNTGGTGFNGVATIVDTGNGTIFNPDGSENTSATKDDDRPVTVTSPTVNEASPFAVFTVDGEPGQLVSLALTPGTATPGAGNDYTSSMEVSTDGGTTWTPYTSGTVALDGTGGTALVRVPILNDNPAVDEPDETFTLTATNTGGTGFDGTATIVDDGNGAIFNPDGSENTTDPKDDDRTLSVSSPTVNEASSHVVFTVSVSIGQNLALALGNGTARGGTTSPTDGSVDFGNAALQYSLDNGVTWVDYTGAFDANLTGGATDLLVRTTLVNDTTPDDGETLTLTATVTGGTGVIGTATIKDDGTGAIFNPDGSENTSDTRDDDRPVTVTSPTVNEASPFAVFTVDGEPGQLVSLALTAGTATPGAGNDYTSSMEVSTDGGATWTPYTSGTVALDGTGGTILVRVPVLNDTTDEPDETFTLTATNTGGTPFTGTATIVDTGDGTIFNPDGSENTSATKDDDRPVTVTSPTVNEASPFAVFTVDGEPGQLVSLALTAGSATSGTDYTPSMEVSTDGGTTWTPYTSGTVALDGTGGTILVRVPVLNDTTNEPDETFTLTATNTGGTPFTGTATIVDDGDGTIFNPDGSENTTDPKDDDTALITGTDFGCYSGPIVRVVHPGTGTILAERFVYEPSFRGGVRVYGADITGDGIPEILAVPGPGRPGEVRVFDRDLNPLPQYNFFPFGQAYRTGLEVAAGSVTGVGQFEIVAAQSRGLGLVRVFTVNPGTRVEPGATRQFQPFGPRYRGGVTVATADVGAFAGRSLVAPSADGVAEIIVGSGPGIPAQVRAYTVIGRTPAIVGAIRTMGSSNRGVSLSRLPGTDGAIDRILVAAGQRSGGRVETWRQDGGRFIRDAAFAGFGGTSASVFAAAVNAENVYSVEGVGGRSSGIRKHASLSGGTASEVPQNTGFLPQLRLAILRR